jgi:hypothetical protein
MWYHGLSCDIPNGSPEQLMTWCLCRLLGCVLVDFPSISLDYLSRQLIGDLVLYGSRLYGLTIRVYSHTIPRDMVKVLICRVICVWRTIYMSTRTILLTSVDSHKSLMLKSSASYDCVDRPCEHSRDRLVSRIANMYTWTIHECHHNVPRNI